MAEMVIRPFESFGPVALDATEDEILRNLGPPDVDFPPTATRGRMFDYRQLGLHVVFDDSGRCEVVESTLRHTPVLNDLLLVGRLTDLIRALEERGFEIRQGLKPGQSFNNDCEALGISLWREDEDQEEIDSVTAWRRGYLDK